MRKAELAVDKKQDDLARAALERAIETTSRWPTASTQQVADQRAQVEILKNALQKLDAKIAEAKRKGDLLIAQSRRARAMNKASSAQMAVDGRNSVATLDRVKTRIQRAEAVSSAKVEIVAGEDIEHRLEMLERRPYRQAARRDQRTPRAESINTGQSGRPPFSRGGWVATALATAKRKLRPMVYPPHVQRTLLVLAFLAFCLSCRRHTAELQVRVLYSAQNPALLKLQQSQREFSFTDPRLRSGTPSSSPKPRRPTQPQLLPTKPRATTSTSSS